LVWAQWQTKSAASTSTSGAGASGSNDLEDLEDSEVGLEQNPAMLVTTMLDVDTNILKDRGDDKNLILYSGFAGKKAKKSKCLANSKNCLSTVVSDTDKDIACYWRPKREHKFSMCPDKRKKGEQNSGKPAATTASVAAPENNLNKLWMATDMSATAGIMERTAQD
jgi:hypothetical protein